MKYCFTERYYQTVSSTETHHYGSSHVKKTKPHRKLRVATFYWNKSIDKTM